KKRPPKTTTRTTAVRFSTRPPLPGTRAHHHPIPHLELPAGGDDHRRGGALVDLDHQELADDLGRELGAEVGLVGGLESVAGPDHLEAVAGEDAVLAPAVHEDQVILSEFADSAGQGGRDAADQVAGVRAVRDAALELEERRADPIAPLDLL